MPHLLLVDGHNLLFKMFYGMPEIRGRDGMKVQAVVGFASAMRKVVSLCRPSHMLVLFDSEEFEWRRCRKDLAVVAAMTLWALLGNALYTGEVYDFNWFFVTQDPFYILPPEIAKKIMPFAAPLAFFVVELVLYGVWKQWKKASGRRY